MDSERLEALYGDSVHRFVAELHKLVAHAHNHLQMYPMDAHVDESRAAHCCRAMLLRHFHEWVTPSRGFTLADLCWIAWSYLAAKSSTHYRAYTAHKASLEFAQETRARVDQMLNEWNFRFFEIDGVGWVRLKQQLSDLERDCVMVTVYYCSNVAPPSDVTEDHSGSVLAYDDDDRLMEAQETAARERDENLSYEQMAREKKIREEEKLKTDDQKRAEAEAHARKIIAEVKTKFGDLESYKKNVFDARQFYLSCQRLFTFSELQFALFDKWTDRGRCRSAYPDHYAIRQKNIESTMDKWLLDQALIPPSDSDERFFRETVYQLCSSPGATELYQKLRNGVNRKTMLSWNIILADRGPGCTTSIAAQIIDDPLKLLRMQRKCFSDTAYDVPSSSSSSSSSQESSNDATDMDTGTDCETDRNNTQKRDNGTTVGDALMSFEDTVTTYSIDACILMILNRLFKAYFHVDFADDCIVFQHDIAFAQERVRGSEFDFHMRQPLIVQCFNVYWVSVVSKIRGQQTGTRSYHRTLFKCGSLKSAVCFYLYLIATRHRKRITRRIDISRIIDNIIK